MKYVHMKTNQELSCPSCKSINLTLEELRPMSTLSKVTFGFSFLKSNLLAFACKDCGFVFLMLRGSVGELE